MQAKEEVIFTIIVVILVLVFIAIFFLVFLARNNNRKNRLLYENERIRKEFEQTLLNTQLEIQEQTLDHVSREIHDNIGQTLSLARLQINTSEPTEDTEVADQLLGKAIADLRTLSHSLNTNHIKENGFTESLRTLLGQFEKTGKFKVEYVNNNEDLEISDDAGLIVFRVVQEILNNITKHANADKISVAMYNKAESSGIRIEDNGCGFDMNELKEKGIGLRNIADRIRIIGGKLSINSEINKGTKIEISLPHAEPTDQSGIGR